MEFFLPDMGVELHILERKKDADVVISASLVRKAIQDGNTELVRSLVPETTYRYLTEKYSWVI